MIGKKFTELTRVTEPSGSDQFFIHTADGAKRVTIDDVLAEQEHVHIQNSSIDYCALDTCSAAALSTDTLTASSNVSIGGDATITGSVSTSGDVSAPTGAVTANEVVIGGEDVAAPTGIQFWKGGQKKGHFAPTNVGIKFEQDDGVGSLELHAPIEVYGTNTYIDFHANNSDADYTTRIINFGTEPDTLAFMKPVDSGIGLARCLGNFQTSSSRKLKENIALISDYEAIDKIMEMEPVTFDYKWGDSSCGFIAEDMLSVLPEAVNIPEGYDEETFEYTGIESAAEAPSIDYTKIIPYLVKVVQSQQEEIEKLKRHCKH